MPGRASSPMVSWEKVSMDSFRFGFVEPEVRTLAFELRRAWGGGGLGVPRRWAVSFSPASQGDEEASGLPPSTVGLSSGPSAVSPTPAWLNAASSTGRERGDDGGDCCFGEALRTRGGTTLPLFDVSPWSCIALPDMSSMAVGVSHSNILKATVPNMLAANDL